MKQRRSGLLLLSICLVLLLAVAVFLPLSAKAAPGERPAYTLAGDLTAYWKLDETTGNRADTVGSNTLQVNGTDSYATGKISNAWSNANTGVLFHGSNATLQTGNIDYTISGWFYPTSLPANGVQAPIVDRRGGGDGEYEVFLYNSSGTTKLYFNVRSTTNSVLAEVQQQTIQINTWYFFVAWHDATNNTLGLSVDDSAVTSNYSSGTPGLTTANFNIDQWSSYYFVGRVDEVGFWKRLLTTGEKSLLYNNGNGCAYPFTTCAPTPTPTATGSPTPLHISINYIDMGGFEFPDIYTSAWDVNITNSTVRLLANLGSAPSPLDPYEMMQWAALGYSGPQCGNNSIVLFSRSPNEDLRTGIVSQDFAWPGGSMYISFNGRTAGDTKGVISLLNEDTGMIIPVDPNFRNKFRDPDTGDWVTAHYVYNVAAGNYRFNAGAASETSHFGWFAIDDVNIHSGWFYNECGAPWAPGLIPAQVAPQFPTVPPYTPIAPTEWLPWPSTTPLSPPAIPTLPPFVTEARTPLAPPPDYTPGSNILRNASFESILNFHYWLPSRWSRVLRLGGIEGRANVDLEMGLQPPAISQHWDMRVSQPAYVSFWTNSNSHLTVAIREAPTGIFKKMFRVDTQPLSGWTKHEFVTPVLAAGNYSIEITNIFQQNAQVDEVAITVGLPYTYPSYFPGIQVSQSAQETATAYWNFIATYDAAALATANAQATQDIYDDQTQAAALTGIAQTQAVATLNAAQAGTATAQSYWATQTRQAQVNSAAQTATAYWQQVAIAQTQAAYTAAAQTQSAIRATQTAQANQTQIVLTAQATFYQWQTQIALTAQAPAALTQTAQAIILTAQAPFYATQTAIALQLTQTAVQATATAQGTPPLPTATVDVLATQAALPVPDQPEPYWAAICGRPPNSLNLAWWLDYEVCRILSWFAWSPVNTTQIQTWLIQLSQYEPFGVIQETVTALTTLRDIFSAFDWNNTGMQCVNTDVSLDNLFPQASGVLTGNFQFVPGDPIDVNCATPIRGVVGDALADGICGSISILCQHGLLAWLQYIFDAALILAFVNYIQAAWIEKATQG